MKARKFLAYLAMATVCCGFAVGCDDNDEPENPYDNAQIKYVDKRTAEEFGNGTDGFLDFNWDFFYMYNNKVEITRYADRGEYIIYIPSEASQIFLEHSNAEQEKVMIKLTNPVFLNSEEIIFEENVDTNKQYGLWHEKHMFSSNDLTITYTIDYTQNVEDGESDSMSFNIAANDGDERKISLTITNEGDRFQQADVTIIQAGKN